MSPKIFLADSEVLNKIVTTFERVDPKSRKRLFHTLGTFLGIGQIQSDEIPKKSAEDRVRETGGGTFAKFTEDRSLSAKEFILQKQPFTDIERVACLAYYLTHYQDRPHFKTIDISRLNTEAAQIKFSNPAFAVGNATNAGYITQAGKGFKQITALGERFVAALPDREAAKEAMSTIRKRRSSKVRKKKAVRTNKYGRKTQAS